MTKHDPNLTRRRFLKIGAAATAAGVAHGLLPRYLGAQSESGSADAQSRKLLFVICAHGGASIIDSFLPVLDTEAGEAAATLNCFPERLLEQAAGSAFRTVGLLDDYGFYSRPSLSQAQFLTRHGQDVAVFGHSVSSVNHNVGQQRSLNGGGIDRGRTIMESAALRYGAGLPLPNCNMAIDGYVRHGADPSVPASARHEVILHPQLFGTGTHGYQGIADAPAADLIARARRVRERLDTESRFLTRFEADQRLQAYLRTRKELSPKVEAAGLVEKLLLSAPEGIDPRFGVTPDPLTLTLRGQLPHMDYDSIEAQVALSFLLGYHGVSNALTIGFTTAPVVLPGGEVVGAPLSYDFSHNSHRQTQSVMWARTLQTADALINLLKTYDYLGDPSLGKMWDRSLIYIASEFGRSKERPKGAESWGTGHDLNNGSVMISPLIKGNTLFGGVAKDTGLTYGFDPETGAPDPKRQMNEGDIYGILAHALDVEAPGVRRYPGVVRAA